jgi:hypothetical protein
MASSNEATNDVDYDQTTNGVYTCQQDLFTTHLLFPMPGRESGNALRDYLQKWRPSVPLQDIPFDHLLDLQALFWRETSSTIFAPNLSVERYGEVDAYWWRAGQTLSAEVRAITDLLESKQPNQCDSTLLTSPDGKHVFIVHEKSNRVCNNRFCPHARTAVEDASTGNLPRKLSLEPLLDWGTVKPASDITIAKGRVFPFRRNGVKMDDALWHYEVKKRVGAPKPLPTYCVKCLEEAMARRAEAWGIGEQPACHVQPPIRRPTSEKEMYGGEDSYTFVECGFRCAGGQQMEQRKSYDEWVRDQASNDIPSSPGSGHVSGLQLDGINVSPSEKKQEHNQSTSFGNNNIYVRVKQRGKDETTATLPTHRASDSSFTPPPSPRSIHNVAPPQYTYASPYPSLHDQRSTPNTTPSTTRASVYRDLQSPDDYEKPGSKALLEDSIPDFGTGHRKFGRQIDTNLIRTICHKSVIRRRGIAEEAKNKAFAKEIEMAKEKEMKKTQQLGIQNFFTVINPPSTTATPAVAGPSTPKRAAKANNVDYEESDLSELPSGLETDEDREASGAEYSPVKGKSKRPATPRKQKTPPTAGLTPTKSAKEKGPPYTPVHRKKDPASPFPDDVTEEAYLDHLNRVPEKHDIICTCRKAAQTYDVQLTQCANPSCNISWVHKECLDKSGKLKARFGTYMCDVCCAEESYRDHARKNGHTTKKLVRNEMAMPFTGEQVVGVLGNMGGFTASADPYGMASSPLTLLPAAPILKPTGAAALAQLAVGSAPSLSLTTSRPYFVNEAYTNAEANKAEADEEWEYAQPHGGYDVGSEEWDESLGEGQTGGEESGTQAE